MFQLGKLDNEKSYTKYIYDAIVVSVDKDGYGGGEIVARIPRIDKSTSENELPKAYPLYGMFFYCLPKVGEKVRVLLSVHYNADDNVNREKRYYFPPVVSQPQKLKKDDYYYTASSIEPDGWVEPLTPISEIPSAKGIHPDKEDIAILGRDNTDLVFKEREIILRAGRHIKDNNVVYNTDNPSYIQLKYKKDYKTSTIGSKTITKVENIQPTHNIELVVAANNRVLLKVVRVDDSFVVDVYSESYADERDLVSDINKKLDEYKSQYPRWAFITSSTLFEDYNKIFPNSTKVVNREVRSVDTVNEAQSQESVINMVADRLNLLSHRGNNFDLTTRKGLIDAQTQQKIEKEAYSMVNGEVLVELMQIIISTLINHTHPYHAKEAVKSQQIRQLENYNLQELLNKLIKHK